MKKTTYFAAALLFFSASAFAQRIDSVPPSGAFGGAGPLPELSEGIAVIVNENVISLGEIKARIDLSLLSAGLPDEPEIRQRVAVQVLRSLVDEKLQSQEGERLGIGVSSEEIDAAMKKLAQDNKIPGGDMETFLKAHDIPASTLREQIKATLAWNKIVMLSLRPRVDIGEEEVDDAVTRMRANAGKQEYLVSEIFLPVDRPEDETDVKALADRLADELKKGGSFGAMARQFSQSAGASSGGDIGWIQVGQLAGELDKILQTLQAGEIAGPIRSAGGYHILGVREKRTIALSDIKEMSVRLQQVFRPYGETQDKEGLLREANAIRQTVSSCDGLKDKLAARYPLWRAQDLGEVKLAAAPAWLAEKVENIAEGHASEAMATDKGALMLFVCSRALPEGVDRNAIRNMIGGERLELLARRKLRDLRRDAFIDVRMKDIP